MKNTHSLGGKRKHVCAAQMRYRFCQVSGSVSVRIWSDKQCSCYRGTRLVGEGICLRHDHVGQPVLPILWDSYGGFMFLHEPLYENFVLFCFGVP